MNKIFISHCTEYELGWGQKPDGFMVGEDKNLMLEHIEKSSKSDTPEYFWRYDEPTEIFCDDETYKNIKEQMGKNNIAHFENRHKKQLNLFKRL